MAPGLKWSLGPNCPWAQRITWPKWPRAQMAPWAQPAIDVVASGFLGVASHFQASIRFQKQTPKSVCKARNRSVINLARGPTGTHRALVPNGPWGHKWTLGPWGPSGSWSQMAPGPKWTLGQSGPWVPQSPGPKWSLGPNGPWSQVAPGPSLQSM